MTTATESKANHRTIEPSAHRKIARSPDRPMAKAAKPLPARLRNALFAEWTKLSPNIQSTVDSRELKDGEEERLIRLQWTNQVLVTRHSSPVASWSELTQGEAKRLLREMKEHSGSNAAYRALLIGKIALRLFGSGWEPIVMERCRQRFLTPDTRNLTPDQAHSLMEELLSRTAREEGREIEDLRREFRRGGA